MPQITLEYTSNIPTKDLTEVALGIHEILAKILPTELESCKTRIIKHDHYLIGNGDDNNALVHLSARVLSGRTEEVKDKTAKLVLQYLRNAFGIYSAGLNLQISTEIDELPKSYSKG